MQLSFGPAVMWGERTDTTGSGIGPRQFGLAQGVDLSIAFTSKELYGQEQFPAALARGQGKVTGKVKVPRINVRLYSDIFFGLTASVGKHTVSQYEAAVVPAVPPFQIAVANNATFADDLGVFYANSGDAFNRVTTPASAADYTVNLASGVYTFSAADASQAVRISYRYVVGNSGYNVLVTNQVQGTTPYFKMTIFQKVSPGAPGAGAQTLPWTVYLPACHSNSFTIPTAQDAWTMSDFDFSAFADPSGLVMLYNADKQ